MSRGDPPVLVECRHAATAGTVNELMMPLDACGFRFHFLAVSGLFADRPPAVRVTGGRHVVIDAAPKQTKLTPAASRVPGAVRISARGGGGGIRSFPEGRPAESRVCSFELLQFQ